MKKIFILVLIIVFIAIAGIAVYRNIQKQAGGWMDAIQTQASIQESVTKQTEINPVENLPETNLFKSVEINPFEKGYKNPFKSLTQQAE